MSIESLLEDSIITDFMRDPVLQQQAIRKHDYGGAIGGDDNPLAPEDTSVIVVTAIDRGEYRMGSGIRNLNVDVLIRVNGEADNFDGTLLDDLTDAVRGRLQPRVIVTGGISGGEITFSQNGIKVFGIMNSDVTTRTEQGLERIRTVPATFIVARVA